MAFSLTSFCFVPFDETLELNVCTLGSINSVSVSSSGQWSLQSSSLGSKFSEFSCNNISFPNFCLSLLFGFGQISGSSQSAIGQLSLQIPTASLFSYWQTSPFNFEHSVKHQGPGEQG